ncbi:MAG: hypothetical protein ACPH5P_00645 [Akkermansiaceae bacterium]
MKTAILKLPLTILTLVVSLSGVHAQPDGEAAKDNTSEAVGPKKFWQANLQDESYMVALERITSISKHRHMIDGNTIVTEVIIDAGGSSLARFYCLESEETDASRPMRKQPHETTYAKTVEFRISNSVDLNKLHDSARNAWISGRGKKFTIHKDQTAPRDD